MTIVPVATPDHLRQVRQLFQEYWQSFGFTPCFQNFSGELDSLPGAYGPPQGRLAMALVDGQAAGCIAMRPVDAARCEVKRLYVRPESRGLGAGHALLEWVIAEARAAGYRAMVGDTMPVMDRALAMYERRGFQRTEPYAPQPTPGAVYLRLDL